MQRMALSRAPLGIQAKLTINEPGDRFEHEADRVAESVVGGGAGAASNGSDGEESRGIPPGARLQRLGSGGVGGAGGAGGAANQAAPQIVHDTVQSSGKPLDLSARGFMESRLGYDFGDVRVHTNSRASESARAVNAVAYTVGRDVVFGTGRYAPGTREGRRLLAHELAHVVQQEATDQTIVQRRSDIDLQIRDEAAERRLKASTLIKRHRGNANELAIELLGMVSDWDGRMIASMVLDRIGGEKHALLRALARQLDAAKLRLLGAASHASAFVQRVALDIRVAGENTEAERIISALISPEHAHLVGESAAAKGEVAAALAPRGASLQSITGGIGPIVFDEYWIVMDTMPQGTTPESFLLEMAIDLNAAVQNEVFNNINVFKRTKADRDRGSPAVGDVYDIDIWGPDNGSVMLVERTSSRFAFQTVTTSQSGEHPEYGSREFGFIRQPDGGIRFYTRGASRPGSEPAAVIGGPKQTAGWTAMLKGIGATLAARGGRLRPESFGHWIRR